MAGFDNDIVYANNADFSTAGAGGGSESNGLVTNGQLWIGRTAVNAGGTHIDVNTLTAGSGISITNGPGTITIASTGPNTDLHAPRFIVASSTVGTGANFTSIAAAIAAAQGTGINSTVFIQPGTYTENLTLVSGINLCAFDCDALTPNVTIVGKLTATYTGTVSISGIQLKTNGDYVIESTGANVANLNLFNCYLNLTNANGVHCTNANANIKLLYCNGDCATNAFFIMTAGSIGSRYCTYTSSTNTTTNNTCSGGSLGFDYCYMSCPTTTSGTGAIGMYKSEIICTNTTALTHGGSGNSIAMETRFESGTASAVSIGDTLPMVFCSVFSTNTNAITGAGTLKYAFIAFFGASASSTVNTSTQTALATLI